MISSVFTWLHVDVSNNLFPKTAVPKQYMCLNLSTNTVCNQMTEKLENSFFWGVLQLDAHVQNCVKSG